MTKETAIQEMNSGHYVRHKYFSDKEAITIDHGLIIDVDGNILTDFWKYRKQEFWNSDWEIVYTSPK